MKQAKKLTVIGFILMLLMISLSFIMLNKVNTTPINNEPQTALSSTNGDSHSVTNFHSNTLTTNNYQNIYISNSVADQKTAPSKTTPPAKDDIIIWLVLFIIFGVAIVAVLVIVVILKLLILS